MDSGGDVGCTGFEVYILPNSLFRQSVDLTIIDDSISLKGTGNVETTVLLVFRLRRCQSMKNDRRTITAPTAPPTADASTVELWVWVLYEDAPAICEGPEMKLMLCEWLL